MLQVKFDFRLKFFSPRLILNFLRLLGLGDKMKLRINLQSNLTYYTYNQLWYVIHIPQCFTSLAPIKHV